VSLFGEAYQPLLLMILPPGAFIAMGLLLAGMNRLEDARR
nr:electron transport complex subunit RsxE [Desulfuromonadales bacterium]NIS41966.1 electron transport complex subunit RsxE [Desulfuromonadales bacterium]